VIPLVHNVVLNLFLQFGDALLPMGLLPSCSFSVFFISFVYCDAAASARPQQKMLSSLQNGNTVVTSGGIVGTIVAVDGDDTLVLRVKTATLSRSSHAELGSSLVSPKERSRNNLFNRL